MSDDAIAPEVRDVIPPTSVAALPVDHGKERERRLRLSIVSALFTRPLALITPIITVRLFLRYLGEERYGLYQAIAAMAVWFGLTNAGLGLGLVNRLADCYVSNDRLLARRYVSSIVFALGAISLVCIALLAIITPFVDWNGFFNVTDPRAMRETPWAVFIAGAVTLLGIWLTLPLSIYTAYQELHHNNLWDAASRIAALAACFAVVYTGWGLVGVIFAATGVATLVRAVNMAWMFAVEKPWLRPSLASFDMRLLQRLMYEGICFFVLQMAVMALFQTDKVIISATLDPAEVTPYSTLGQVFISGYGVIMLFLGSLWPAYAEALRRGEMGWVRRMVRWSLLGSCTGILLLGGVPLLLFGRPLIRLWIGEDLSYSNNLVIALTLLFALRAWVDCRSAVLNSAGVLIPQMFFFGAHAILNLAIAIPMGKRYGAEGVAWTTVITAIITTGWGYPWMMRRYIWNQPDRFVTKVEGFPVQQD
jgi:O-antigen/teichoic acid export membrane protein